LTYQIANSLVPAEREGLLTRLGETEKEFHDRQKVWQNSLPSSRMKEALVVDSAKFAEDFFQLVHARFVPVVQKGDLEAARNLANQELRWLGGAFAPCIVKFPSQPLRKPVAPSDPASAALSNL
jgi:hypothetical protein